MADPKSNVHNYDDPFLTLDDMLRSDVSLGLDYEGLDDQPTAESTRLNEEMNQLPDYHRKGKNIMLDDDAHHIGDYHRKGKNIMLDDDAHQIGDYHRKGKNIMLDDDAHQIGDYHRKGKNIMLDDDANQIGDYHRKGKNVMINEDMNQFEDYHYSEDMDQFEDYHLRGSYIMFNEEMIQYEQGTSQVGTSRVNDQINAQMPGMFNPEIPGCENPIQIPEWPLSAIPYACSCCQVLREIIHTIEGGSKKFEIHGRLGMISHGILEIRRGDMTAPYKEYHMFDFCKESIQRVKMFLEQYCEKQKEAGYTMVNDPLLTFYQVVSVGLNWDVNFDPSDILRGSPVHIGDIGQPNVNEPRDQSNEVGSSKMTHKEKMDQIATLTIYDFAKYFHLKQELAAKKVGVSASKCKTICRNGGLKKWPFRTVRRCRKAIAERSKSLNSANAAERERAEADIQKLEKELAQCYPPFETDKVAEGDATNETDQAAEDDENDEGGNA